VAHQGGLVGLVAHQGGLVGLVLMAKKETIKQKVKIKINVSIDEKNIKSK
jgi:uncharacterized protein involved in propanediol utilization